MKRLLLAVVAMALIASPVMAQDNDKPKGWPFDLSLGVGIVLDAKDELDMEETWVYEAGALLRFGSFVALGGEVIGDFAEMSIVTAALRGDLYFFGDKYALTPFANLVVGGKRIDIDHEVTDEWILLLRPGGGLAFRNQSTSLLGYFTVDYLDSESIAEFNVADFVDVTFRVAWVNHFGE